MAELFEWPVALCFCNYADEFWPDPQRAEPHPKIRKELHAERTKNAQSKMIYYEEQGESDDSLQSRGPGAAANGNSGVTPKEITAVAAAIYEGK